MGNGMYVNCSWGKCLPCTYMAACDVLAEYNTAVDCCCCTPRPLYLRRHIESAWCGVSFIMTDLDLYWTGCECQVEPTCWSRALYNVAPWRNASTSCVCFLHFIVVCYAAVLWNQLQTYDVIRSRNSDITIDERIAILITHTFSMHVTFNLSVYL